MGINDLLGQLDETIRPLVKSAYEALDELSPKKDLFPLGVPRIQIVIKVRNAFSSPEGIKTWESYEGTKRIELVQRALDILCENKLASSEKGERYKIVR